MEVTRVLSQTPFAATCQRTGVQVQMAVPASSTNDSCTDISGLMPRLVQLYQQLSLSHSAAHRKVAVQSVLEGLVAVLSALPADDAAGHARALLTIVWDMRASSDPGARCRG